MKFTVLLPVLSLASYTFGAALQARDAATVLNDISTIVTQTNQLKADVDAFQKGSGTSAVLKINSDSNTLDKTLKQAGTDTQNSATFSDSDSANIANAVVVLQPTIFATLTSLINKKDAFRTALGGGSAVSSILIVVKLLRTDTAYFGANVTAKLTPILSKAAPLLTGDIDYHFQRAVDAFSTP